MKIQLLLKRFEEPHNSCRCILQESVMSELNESRTELFSRVQTLKKVRLLASWYELLILDFKLQSFQLLWQNILERIHGTGVHKDGVENKFLTYNPAKYALCNNFVITGNHCCLSDIVQHNAFRGFIYLESSNRRTKENPHVVRGGLMLNKACQISTLAIRIFLRYIVDRQLDWMSVISSLHSLLHFREMAEHTEKMQRVGWMCRLTWHTSTVTGPKGLAGSAEHPSQVIPGG